VSIYADNGEGVVFLSNSRRPFNAAIDTDGYVDERELFDSE